MSKPHFYIVADKSQCAEIEQIPHIKLAEETIKVNELQVVAAQPKSVIKLANYSSAQTAVDRPASVSETDKPIEVRAERFQILTYGKVLELSYLEYKLLAFLIENAGKAYSRADLLSNVWGINYYGTTRTVDVHIRRVRAKLGPELAKHLQTVRSAGYLWDV